MGDKGEDKNGHGTSMASTVLAQTDDAYIISIKAIDDDGDELAFRLYPIGEDEFGRKGGMLDLKFGEGCLMFDHFTCKKL